MAAVARPALKGPVAGNRDAVHAAALAGVIVDCVVEDAAVVPDRHRSHAAILTGDAARVRFGRMSGNNHMAAALAEAAAAAARGEVPVGAVLVDGATGAVLARSGNRIEELRESEGRLAEAQRIAGLIPSSINQNPLAH